MPLVRFENTAMQDPEALHRFDETVNGPWNPFEKSPGPDRHGPIYPGRPRLCGEFESRKTSYPGRAGV